MIKGLTIPEGYKSLLDIQQTERAIKFIKDTFQQQLSSALKLRRVTAPLFVLKGTGINDDLNGTERAVTFKIKSRNDAEAEIVHSLAKWKRMALADYGIPQGYGLYTDMNALRPDEDLDNIHSIYVDQWDWERSMKEGERNLEFLKHTVNKIYDSLKRTEYLVSEAYPFITPILPCTITFVHTEDLLAEYPTLTPRERETKAAEKYGAIFVIGIGGKLANNEKHDGRAPDYDDWTTPTSEKHKGLNGDIVVWNPLFKNALELSSMGIRVDKEAMLRQLEIEGASNRTSLAWHKKLLDGKLPQSIGGGIGQSRLCMFLLRKAHIGEVQSSLWADDMLAECKKHGIDIL